MAGVRTNLVQPLLKRNWQYQLELNKHTPCDSAINTLGYRPKKNKYMSPRNHVQKCLEDHKSYDPQAENNLCIFMYQPRQEQINHGIVIKWNAAQQQQKSSCHTQ